MTLILTIANKLGVYQSSDYQLTDSATGTPSSDRAGSKQIHATFESIQLELAFTGIARIGTQRTMDWLAEELKALKNDVEIEDICRALTSRCTSAVKPYGSRGILTLVLAFSVVGGPFQVAVISNFDWKSSPLKASASFTTTIHTITKPFQLISGYRGCVPPAQRYRLKALSRLTDRSPKEMMDALSEINSIAAKRSSRWVSEGCWVTSQVQDGTARRSAAINVGQHNGVVPHVLGGFDLGDWVKKNFRTAPGRAIGLVQSAGVQAAMGIPVPPPEGERAPLNFLGLRRSARFGPPLIAI